MGSEDTSMQATSTRPHSQALAQRYLLKAALQEICNLLPRVTGYRFLQIGRCQILAQSTRNALCLPNGRAVFFVMDVQAGAGVDAVIHPAQLPLPDGCMDAVILPFSLEMQRRPHPLLREVDRILSPRGQLIVCASNPLHPPTAWNTLRQTPRAQWRSLQTAHRLQDWLSLLDYEVESVRCIPQSQITQRFRWLNWLRSFSPAYVLMARKRSITLTPIRTKLRVLRRVQPVAVPEARTARVRALENRKAVLRRIR